MQRHIVFFTLMFYLMTPVWALKPVVGFIDNINGIPSDFQLIRDNKHLTIAPYQLLLYIAFPYLSMDNLHNPPLLRMAWNR